MLPARRAWNSQPPPEVGAASYPGLRNLWHFNGSRDDCRITGARLVYPAQPLAVSWLNDRALFVVSGWATTSASLPLSFSATAPVTILIGYELVSNVANQVAWSLMSPLWDGWYAGGAVGAVALVSTADTDFSGAVSPTVPGLRLDRDVRYVAMTMAGANDLRASVDGGPVAIDTSSNNPTPTANSTFYLGGTTDASNRSNTVVKYVALLNRAVGDVELRELSGRPWRWLFKARSLQIPVTFTASSAPTLSDLKAVSVTATTVQGTYDYAF